MREGTGVQLVVQVYMSLVRKYRFDRGWYLDRGMNAAR